MAISLDADLRVTVPAEVIEIAGRRDVPRLRARPSAESPGESRPQLAPGAKLTRVYQGRKVTATVLENGFEFEGERYASLSAVARAATSFVSVTQQLNSSSPMGRLTLNVLLSFAQFERKIISERTRDKVCAARRKGKWIGGYPVLGYDVDPVARKLVVNETEADQVRRVFKAFLGKGSLTATLEAIESLGVKFKGWTSKRGPTRWGVV